MKTRSCAVVQPVLVLDGDREPNSWCCRASPLKAALLHTSCEAGRGAHLPACLLPGRASARAGCRSNAYTCSSDSRIFPPGLRWANGGCCPPYMSAGGGRPFPSRGHQCGGQVRCLTTTQLLAMEGGLRALLGGGFRTPHGAACCIAPSRSSCCRVPGASAAACRETAQAGMSSTLPTLAAPQLPPC